MKMAGVAETSFFYLTSTKFRIMKKIFLSGAVLLFALTVVTGQKKSLTFDDIEKWNRITQTEISDDGQWVAYKMEPWKGDTEVKVVGKNGKESASFINGTGLVFTSDSKYLLFTRKPLESTVRDLKLKNKAKEDMPKDAMVIYTLGKGSLVVENIKSFKVPDNFKGWMAYQTGAESKGKTDSTEVRKKVQSDKNGFALLVRNLNTGAEKVFPFVKQYMFSKEGNNLLFVSSGNNGDFDPGIYMFNLQSETTERLFDKDEVKQLYISENAKAVAFIFNGNDKDKTGAGYSLYLSKGSQPAEMIAGSNTSGIPGGWIISPDKSLQYSEESGRLFFGTAPSIRLKDSTRLEDEIPVVDIWHWQEGKLHTQQVVDKASDLKASHAAVYNVDRNEVVLLGGPEIETVIPLNEGNSEYALGLSNLPYQVVSMWEGSPEHNDVYLINMLTGKKEMIKKDLRARVSGSPDAKYLFWYHALDTCWYTYNISTGKETKITTPAEIMVADEMDDSPNLAGSYSYAGWLKKDEAILIYDRYDIWKVDPEHKKAPVNITMNGRSSRINYRVVPANREDRFVDPAGRMFLAGHNELTRYEGYYFLSGVKQAVPTELISGPFTFGTPQFSKDLSTIVYTKETFTRFS